MSISIHKQAEKPPATTGGANLKAAPANGEAEAFLQLLNQQTPRGPGEEAPWRQGRDGQGQGQGQGGQGEGEEPSGQGEWQLDPSSPLAPQRAPVAPGKPGAEAPLPALPKMTLPSTSKELAAFFAEFCEKFIEGWQANHPSPAKPDPKPDPKPPKPDPKPDPKPPKPDPKPPKPEPKPVPPSTGGAPLTPVPDKLRLPAGQDVRVPTKIGIAAMDKWDAQISKASISTGLPANYIKAVIWAESRGNPDDPSQNPDGSHTDLGVMQISDYTYGDVMKNQPKAPRNLHANKPEDNIMMGAWELRDKFNWAGHNNSYEATSAAYRGVGDGKDGSYANAVVQFWLAINQGKKPSDSGPW